VRIPLIAGNWKMNLTRQQAVDLAKQIAAKAGSVTDAELAVCPPSVYLDAVREALGQTPVRLGAQNMYFKPNGAFTGEISGEMLVDLRCHCVILGHSERRHVLGEKDADVNEKVKRALGLGLVRSCAWAKREPSGMRARPARSSMPSWPGRSQVCRPTRCSRWSSPTNRSGRSEVRSRPPRSKRRRSMPIFAGGSRPATMPPWPRPSGSCTGGGQAGQRCTVALAEEHRRGAGRRGLAQGRGLFRHRGQRQAQVAVAPDAARHGSSKST